MKRIEILMSAYNGDKFIEEQIESIMRQRDVDVHLTIRDDGSSDETVSVIKKNAGKVSKCDFRACRRKYWLSEEFSKIA